MSRSTSFTRNLPQSKAQPRLTLQRLIAFLWVAMLLSGTSVTAQSVYHPQGLQLGAEYRLIFFTAGTRDAQSPRIADYNTFVTEEANLPGSIVRDLETEWFAVASTARVDAIENTSTDYSPPGDTGVPIYFVDGITRFADHYDNLWNPGSIGLGHPMQSQFGISGGAPSNNVWTGTDYHGIAGGIGGPLGSSFPSLGVSQSGNSRWINNKFTSASTQTKSLYAMSSVLVVVPEPSTAALLGVLISLGIAVRRRSPANNRC